MGQFLGSHQNRLDSKGRVSVPAPFRATLRENADPSLVLRPSHNYRCIEAWPAAAFAAMAEPLDSMDQFSQDSDDLQFTLFADAFPVEPDKEGRIVLPDLLKQHAGLVDAVTFMGMRRLFLIWEPAAAIEQTRAARERATSQRLTVPGRMTIQ